MGGGQWERVQSVSTDAEGNIYVAGSTKSGDFPTTPGAFDQTGSNTGQNDGFVACIAPDGTSIVWSTYLQGSSRDDIYGIRVGPDGFVYVAGWTRSTDFPTTRGAHDRSHNGEMDVFVAKLRPDGSGLVYATFLGGSGTDQCRGAMHIDEAGAVYFAGYTDSVDFPTTPGALQRSFQGGYGDAYIARLSPDGATLEFATYLGSSGPDHAFAGLGVHSDGSIVVTGVAGASDFPVTANAFQPQFGGNAGHGVWNGDAFVARIGLTPERNAQVHYISFLGGSGDEKSTAQHGLVIDKDGSVFVSGATHSSDFPTTSGAYQQRLNGQNNLYIAKISADGSRLLASTYLGGTAGSGYEPSGMAIDALGHVLVSGSVYGTVTNHPITPDAFQTAAGGGSGEAFFVALSSDLENVQYSTFLGGSDADRIRDLTLLPSGSVVVVGDTLSSDFPVTPGVFQENYTGAGDAQLVRFDPGGSLITVDPTVSFQTIHGWECVAFCGSDTSEAFALYKDELFDRAVNEAGINRLQLSVRSGAENIRDYYTDYQTGVIDYDTWRAQRYATVNDNNDPGTFIDGDGDPATFDPAGFLFTELDHKVENIIIPMRQRVEANGEYLYVYLHYVASLSQITTGQYHHDDPAEYAEFILAAFSHLWHKYAWVPDGLNLFNEPNGKAWWGNGTHLGEALVAVARRLEAHGFTPDIIAPQGSSVAGSVNLFDQMIQVPGVLNYLDEYSYHRYGFTTEGLQGIAARAEQYHLRSSMTEWWNNDNSYTTLHEDLKMVGSAAWQQGVMGGPDAQDADPGSMMLYGIDTSDPTNPRVIMWHKTKYTRHYYCFVRSGALRIDAGTTDPHLDPLAFVNTDGGTVVVVKADAGRDFWIQGLPAGTYGIKYTTGDGINPPTAWDVDLPDQTIFSGQVVEGAIPGQGILTVYAKTRSSDLIPPSAPTGLTASEVSPSQIELSWEPSTDNVVVVGYRIHRNNVPIGFSPAPTFLDTSASPGIN